MKLGLATNWDGPRRRFFYMFEAGDNDTLEIIELQSQTDWAAHLPCDLDLYQCPAEVKAEINMSMGHAGMMALKPNWWGRVKARLWLFKHRWHMRWIKLVRRPT